jgi:hypothetical protein
MSITTSVDREKQLTIFTIVGEPSFEDVMDNIKSFHEHPTKNTLWDLRVANLIFPSSSSENLQALVEYAKAHGKCERAARQLLSPQKT